MSMQQGGGKAFISKVQKEVGWQRRAHFPFVSGVQIFMFSIRFVLTDTTYEFTLNSILGQIS